MSFRTSLSLLTPKILTLKNSLFSSHRSFLQRFILFTGSLLVLGWLPTAIFLSVKDSLQTFAGDTNPTALLELIATTFASILFIAACIHALQIFFLSRENELFLLSPISKQDFFIGRYLENCFAASWIILLLFLPIFYGYASHIHASWIFILEGTVYFLLLILTECALAIAVVVILSLIYTARRLKELFIIIALAFIFFLHFYSKSTEFVFPKITNGAVENFEESLRTWHHDISLRTKKLFSLPLIEFEKGDSERSISLFVALIALWGVTFGASFRIFSDFYQFSDSLERWQQSKKIYARSWFRRPPTLFAGMFQKDLHLFLRDIAQPVQLILFVIIAGITMLSFRQTSLFKNVLGGDELVFNDIIFAVGIMSHLLLTVLFAGRFVFPALALEEESRWLIKSSPISSLFFVSKKFQSQVILSLTILVPLYCVLGFLSDLPTNRLITGAFLASISICGITAIAVGSGGLFARFLANNLGSGVSTLGSFVFMTVSLLVMPLCLVFSISIASFYSLVFSNSLSFDGLVCCIVYATIVRLIGGVFLRRASLLW